MSAETPRPCGEHQEANRRKLEQRRARDWNKVFDWIEGKQA